MGKVIGSLDLIGNPAAIISDISGGVRTFIIHARKAVLGGLSPAQNRQIPPLRYGLVS